MFRVKICGITNVEDAVATVEAGADAIGLNFYDKSARSVDQGTALDIVRRSTADHVHRVGVFVNMQRDRIEVLANLLLLSAIQLHGEEPPEMVAYFAKPRRAEPYPAQGRHPYRRAVVRARRIDDRGVAAIAADLQACRDAGWPPAAVLVDAMTPGRYGGTGETVSWIGLVDHRRWLGDTPLILAGGLTPDNVAEAIGIVRPAAVDVASGVEWAPGRKDPARVRDFVANALGAFEALRH
jgi:phosphoribosylanthranilate isomerase